MVFFGFVGYSFNKYKIPQSPLILASILGSMMENNWTQSMKFADGSLSVFVTRPLSCGLLILSIIFIGLPLWKQWKAKKALLTKTYATNAVWNLLSKDSIGTISYAVPITASRRLSIT